MTTTTYLELDDQTNGANNNTWGDVADANMEILEQAIARYVSIATTGGTTTLTSAQNRYPIIRLTGALVSNATIQVRTAEKNWTFINDTTGSYTVTVKTSGGTGKTLPRGLAVFLYCDATNVEHARDQGIPAAQAGGTADAITATFEPPITSAQLQDGTLVVVEAGSANATTTPTFSPDGLTARTITKNGGQALVAGDIRAAGHKLLLCYDLSSTRWELLNPLSAQVATDAVSGIVELATTTEVLTGTDTARAVTPDALASLWEQGANIASAGTISIGEGGHFLVTGTTTITDIDPSTDKAGRPFTLVFDDALTLTHSATLILPTGADIVTASGDIAHFVSEGSDTVRCVAYQKQDGIPVGGNNLQLDNVSLSGSSAVISGLDLTPYRYLDVWLNDMTVSTTMTLLLGTSTSDDVTLTNSIASGNTYYSYFRMRLNNGQLGGGGIIATNGVNTVINNASTSVSIATSTGTFTAGTMRLHGVR